MVAKSFPRKQVPTKNFHQLFGRKFFMVAKSFPRNQVRTKNFHQIFLVENFLWSQNHFLQNKYLLKIFIKFFWSKIFYCRKIISSKTGPTKNFHQLFLVENFYGRKIISSKTSCYFKFSLNLFGRKFFMVAKSFPRKQVPTENVHQIFLVENFLWSQNHFLENRFLLKILSNF